MKWKEDRDFWSDEYRVISTEAENGITGVGFVMNRKVSQRVSYCEQFSDRVVLIRIDSKPTPTTIVQAYMPTSQAGDEEIEKVYEDVDRVIQHIKGEII